MNIEFKGMDNLLKKLEALGGSVAKATVDGTNKTLQDITADAKNNCPVDTGQLRDSIEPYGDAHKAKEQNGTVAGAAGTNVEHGPYIEFGTGQRGAESPSPPKYDGDLSYTEAKVGKDGEGHPYMGMPAQPYLWPAYLAHESELPDNIKKAADEEIRRLAK